MLPTLTSLPLLQLLTLHLQSISFDRFLLALLKLSRTYIVCVCLYDKKVLGWKKTFLFRFVHFWFNILFMHELNVCSPFFNDDDFPVTLLHVRFRLFTRSHLRFYFFLFLKNRFIFLLIQHSYFDV